MPFKHNAGFRHKFPKAKYAVKTWSGYNEHLRLRGDALIWFDPVMLPGWRAIGRRKRGGQLIYSDLAFELCLTLRVVFGLPLRQTQGFVRSLFKLIDLGLPVPDFSTPERFGADVEIVIPPPCDAIRGDSPMRNAHIEHIKKYGRIAWQKDTGYNERSGVETQVGRYNSVIGSKLQSRNLETHQTETAIAVKSLNRMTRIGRAAYQRVS